MRYVHCASMCGAQKTNCVACSDMVYEASDACCIAYVVEVCVCSAQVSFMYFSQRRAGSVGMGELLE